MSKFLGKLLILSVLFILPTLVMRADDDKNSIIKTKKEQGFIKGRVLDKSGIAIPGVGITIKGNPKLGYITDDDGFFSIPTKASHLNLIFRALSFKTKELKAKNGSFNNILLEDDQDQLEQVVITGFAPKSKMSYTGSSTSLGKSELLAAGSRNLFESLETSVPGMMIVENRDAGSNPNKTPEITIRGRSTFEGRANMPVFIVDGSEVNVDYIYDMDINDIENVTILKDASASALYGAKASAGVVVITTKYIEGGRLKFNYSGTTRLSVPDLTDYHLLNSQQKLEYERLAGLYKGADHEEQYIKDQQYANLYNRVATGIYTDWLKKPLRNGLSHSHSISLDGGDLRAKYNVGLRYSDDQGVMKGSGRSRFSTFFKLSYNITGVFYIMNTSTISVINASESPYGNFGDYARQNPYENPYDAEGKLIPNFNNSVRNPLYEASIGSYDKDEAFDFMNTTNLQVWFAKDFRLSADFSISKSKSESENFISPKSLDMRSIKEPTLRGRLTNNYFGAMSWQGKAILSYNKYFGKLYLSTMAGSTIESTKSYSNSFASVGYFTEKLVTPSFSSSYPLNSKPNGTDATSTGLGFFVNFNTMYNNRYFLDVIYRYEGSSKFGKNQRFAPFWSVGAGWNIHNESFMKNSMFSLLKLRGSIGYLGNISFDPYQAMTTYTYGRGLNYVKGIGAVPVTIGNPALKWQRTLSSNIGIDLNAWHNRIDFSIDYYVKNTDDLLLNVTKAPSIGITTARENLGAVENKGVDLRFSISPLRTENWNWTISTNYSYNINRIKRISNSLKSQNEKNLSNESSVAPLPIYEEGESLTAIKVVPSLGIDPATGNEIFIKRDGTFTFEYDPNDKVIFGDTSPLAFGNISSYLTYKNFSINTSFSYSLGGVIYNTTLATRVEGSLPQHNADVRVFNDRWKKPGDIAKYRNIADSSIPKQSSRFVEKNNYLSFTNLTLAYDLPTKLAQRMHLRRIRLQLMTRNLFYLSTVKQERGLSYPFERSVEFGLRFTL